MLRLPVFRILMALSLLGVVEHASAGKGITTSPTEACGDTLVRATPAPPPLKVVQFNVENLFIKFRAPFAGQIDRMTEDDWQKLAPLGVNNKSLAKTRRLARALREIDADIVFLNEVGGVESLENFAHLFLDDAYDVFLTPGNSPRGIEVGYLVRKDLGVRAELRSHKHRPLNFIYPHEVKLNEEFAKTAPEKMRRSHCFARDCSELRLYAPGAETPSLITLLVHLKATLDPKNIDPEGRLRRGAEAKTLMEIYRETRAEFSPPVPTMVAGDFNGFARSTERAPEFESMADVDLQSVMELGHNSGPAANTHVLGWYKDDGQEIDFIFVSPDLADEFQSSRVHKYKSDDGQERGIPKNKDEWREQPSDHFPVVATFAYPFSSPERTARAVEKKSTTPEPASNPRPPRSTGSAKAEPPTKSNRLSRFFDSRPRHARPR